MGLRDRDIVCVSTHYWDERWFRKQHFMNRFAQANRVLFVEPSFSMARKPEVHLAEVAANRWFLGRLESRDGALKLLKPPRGLPKWSAPSVERLTYRWYGQTIRRAVRRLGMRDPVLWVYRPSYYHSLDAIPHRHLVFDLVDDIAAYGGNENGMPHVEQHIRELVRRSDLVVVTAKTLRERYGDAARRVVQIPNGFEARRFEGRARLDEPAALAFIRRPILGFVGTVFSFIDFGLFERVAHAHRDKSIVLVGPVEASARSRLERLTRAPNVHHIGQQGSDVIPAFIASFDVCLNVFAQNRAADSVIPLKVFEYLAAGKPVVSTSMRALELEPVAKEIAFAVSSEEFCSAIDKCLAEDTGAQTRRRAAVAPYAWDELFARLDAACEEALGL